MITNKRHIAFIDEYLSNGMKSGAAYAKVYNRTIDPTSEVNASKLLSNANIDAEIKRRMAITAKKLEVTKEDMLKHTLEILQDTKKSFPPSALKAIEIINKMQGHNAVEKKDITSAGKRINIDLGLNIVDEDLEAYKNEEDNSEDNV